VYRLVTAGGGTLHRDLRERKARCGARIQQQRWQKEKTRPQAVRSSGTAARDAKAPDTVLASVTERRLA
jgi:hypothetical protein